MKRSSAGTGSPTAPEHSNTGALTPAQRSILRGIRTDGPGTEAELYSGTDVRRWVNMAEFRAALVELEARMLVRCDVQPNGRRIWGMPG